MNSQPLSAAGLERALLSALETTLGDIGWLGKVRSIRPNQITQDGADVVLHVGLPKGQDAELRLHIKKELRPGLFPAWAAEHRTVAKKTVVPVLAMPVVSSRLAGLCMEAGWSWCDLAGNCRLDVPGLLHVERSGIAPVRPLSRPAANLGTAAAARVLRVLLSPAHVGFNWTQRSLQKETCWQKIRDDEPVSLGLVNKIIRHLRDEGYIEGTAAHGVSVRDFSGLLAAWSKAYRFERHRRRLYFTLLKGPELHKALYRVGLDTGGWAVYAAFSAAEHQAPHVRQPKTWLYVAEAHLDSLVRHTQAKEVDSGDNLVVLVPDDSGVLLSFDADSFVGDQSLGCTDPVQTYVDLLHCGGRGEEAAQALLEQRLLPAWKASERT